MTDRLNHNVCLDCWDKLGQSVIDRVLVKILRPRLCCVCQRWSPIGDDFSCLLSGFHPALMCGGLHISAEFAEYLRLLADVAVESPHFFKAWAELHLGTTRLRELFERNGGLPQHIQVISDPSRRAADVLLTKFPHESLLEAKRRFVIMRRALFGPDDKMAALLDGPA